MASKYRDRVQVGADENGNPVYRWATGSTKDSFFEAVARLKNGQAEQISGAPLWDVYAKQWFDTFQRPRLREKTVTKEEGILRKHVAPAFEGVCVDRISTKDVQTFLNGKSEYGQAYLRDIIAMMKRIFRAAVDDELIRKSPMDSEKIFNPSKKKPTTRQALSNAEQADIIAHIDKLEAVEDRRLMALLMFTPMRPCEIYGLQWQDIDMVNGLIHIQRDAVFTKGKMVIGDTKTEKSARTIPMDERLKAFLEPVQAEGFVIVRTKTKQKDCLDEPYTEQGAKCQWARIRNTIDVHGMTPYVGRHTYATNMSRAGVPLRTAIDMMGHTDERMLMRSYVHTDSEDLRQAGRAVAALFSGL